VSHFSGKTWQVINSLQFNPFYGVTFDPLFCVSPAQKSDLGDAISQEMVPSEYNLPASIIPLPSLEQIPGVAGLHSPILCGFDLNKELYGGGG
jgi:hypothetical protein